MIGRYLKPILHYGLEILADYTSVGNKSLYLYYNSYLSKIKTDNAVFFYLPQKVAFQNCYCVDMTELETLLALRNYLNCNEGELLIKYLCKLMTSDCCKGRDAVEIKGFGSCIEAIINIPNEVEKKHKNS